MRPGTSPVESARRAEDLGFDFVSASDHPCGTEPTYEIWTMLSWIAAATTRIRVAHPRARRALPEPGDGGQDGRDLQPACGGRLILGLGGGYSDAEFRAFGLGTFTPRDKVDGLAEAIAITRGLWSRPAFTFGGQLHRTEDASLEPSRPGRSRSGWAPSATGRSR